MKEIILKDSHIKFGAKFINFAGWYMPVLYTGIIEEHLHTRKAVSVFDVSHMSKFFIEGKSALDDLTRLMTCNISSLKKGQCRYGFFLNHDGKFIDDAIIYKIAKEKFMVVANASTAEKDEKWIRMNISENTIFKNISDDIAKIDLQGPYSQKVLSNFCADPLNELKFYHFIETMFIDTEAIISRTGYTGEDGFEIYVKKEKASFVWDRLLSKEPVKPAGLGARDTLRLEMGYPLYGQDISEDYSPVEANLMRFVDLKKEFIGKKAIEQQLKYKAKNILVGFLIEGKRIARTGYKIMYNKKMIGTITSGTYSPSLKRPIALGYIASEFSKHKNVEIQQNGLMITGEITSLPFLKRRKIDSRKV